MRSAALLFAILLAGCDTPTVSWYMQHHEERAEKLAQCADDPGFARIDPGCANAAEARAQLMYAPGGGMPSIL